MAKRKKSHKRKRAVGKHRRRKATHRRKRSVGRKRSPLKGRKHTRYGTVKRHKRRVAKPKRKRRKHHRTMGAAPGGVLATMSRISRV